MTGRMAWAACLAGLWILGVGTASAAELVIGQVASMSGNNGAALGQDLRTGLQCYFKAVNARGGVNGSMLRLVSYDDKYQPDETLRLTRKLIAEDRPVALAGYRGTANTISVVNSKILEDSGLALVGTLSGAVEIQGAPNIYHTRTSYAREIRALVDHLLKIQLRKIAVFYSDDAFGRNGLRAAEEALAASGLKPLASAGYDKSASMVEASVAQAARSLVRAGPQAIVMIAVGDPLTSFVRQARAEPQSVQLFGISVSDPRSLYKQLGASAVGIGFSEVFPYPYSDATRLTREYRANLKACQPEAVPSYPSLEGYVNARVLVEAIRRAGSKPSAASIRAALDRMPSLDLGDFWIEFNPQSRNGSNYVDMTILASGGNLWH